MTTNGSQISFGGDENVLELDRDDDYTVTESHPLKGSVVFHVNFISVESTLVWFGAGSWRAGGQKAAAHMLGSAGFPTLVYVQTPYRGCMVVMSLGHDRSQNPLLTYYSHQDAPLITSSS